MNNNPIGVFDSGVGGLSCVPAIKKALPNESLIYFGDTKRAPYGCRSSEEITEFSIEIAENLIARGCKALAIACNTITAVALPELNKRFDCPVIGIIEPAVSCAKENYAGKRISVIATLATVNSGAYPFRAKAAPRFVPFIEAEGRVPDEVIKAELDELITDTDVLILGCTHYPFIEADIRRLYPGLEIINPADSLAKELKRVLKAKDMLSELNSDMHSDIFLASEKTAVFDDIVNRIR